MTEHEKMLAGLIYDPYSEGMAQERSKTHRLCKLYNDTFDTETEKREEILSELLPNRGKNSYVQGPVYFDFGTNISVGDNFYANFNFTVLDEGRVKIGNSVFIGPNVTIATPIHPLCYQDRNTNLEYTAPITIEDNCWIASNVTICGGVAIGEGCVIGAGSVVTRDIPPHSLAVGNPCRVVRKITEADRLSAHPELFVDELNACGGSNESSHNSWN